MSQFDRVMSVYSQKIAKKTLQKSAWCHLEQWSNGAIKLMEPFWCQKLWIIYLMEQWPSD